MTEERRKRTRAPVHFEVTVLLHGESIRLETENISLTGILCTADKRFHSGESCEVVIKLNPEVVIDVDAVILRTSEGKTAISFVRMDDESFYHLKKLIELNAGDADRIEDELQKPAFE
jgi:hypothetical protein